MKLFYNESGEVIGQMEGATPEIEASLGMPGCQEVQAPQVVSQLISDPHISFTHTDLEVKDGEIILKDFGISLSEAPLPETPVPVDETPQP